MATIFILFHHTLLSQPNISFEQLTVTNGLSQSTVFSIAQDAQGFMWFGTRDGLNRYDSRNIKIFKTEPKSSNSLSSNIINTLLVDSKGILWVGTDDGLNIYNAISESFTQVRHTSKHNSSLTNNSIGKIYEDSRHNIWVGTLRGLNLLTDKASFKFSHFDSSKDKLLSVSIQAIKEDSRGNLYVGTKYGLVKMKFLNGRYTTETFTNQLDKRKNDIKHIAEDAKGNIWLGTEAGVQFLDTLNKAVVSSHDGANLSGINTNVRKIVFLKDNKVWLATIRGAYLVDAITGAARFFENDPEDNTSLGQNSVYDIFEDKAGTLWFGTYFGGISILYKDAIDFTVYRKSRNPNSIGSNIISSIVEDSNSNLIVGSQEAGLSYCLKNQNAFTKYQVDETKTNGLYSNIIKVLYKDKSGNIWVGANFLQLFNPAAGTFATFKIDKTSNQNIIYAISETGNGKYWVSVRDMGLYIFDIRTKLFTSAEALTGGALNNKIVKYIYTDNYKNTWFGTYNGLFVLNFNSKKIEKFSAETKQPGSLIADNVNVITEDANKNIWIGTVSGGLSRYNPSTKKITTYTIDDGLPGNTIIGILEDSNGFLWLSTENGLSCFNAAAISFRNYNTIDGLPSNIFNQNAFLKGADGNLYFGSYGGLVKFNPSQVHINTARSSLVLTTLSTYDEKANSFKKNSLKSDTGLSVELNYNQNTIKIDFAILNFIKPLKNTYRYQLQGFDKTWNETKTPTATYTNLSPGSYFLLIQAANNDGIWQTDTLQLSITILSPPWRSWWAYLLYTLVAVAVISLGVNFVLIKYRLKREEQVHQMKLDFFTNISHELRTPLTLILGPIEALLTDKEITGKIKNKLQQAKFNCDRLLRLVTELLDFRKTETKHLTLQVGRHNLIDFCRKVFCSFEDMALQKNIGYVFFADIDHTALYFDDIQLEKVLYNLLSNAFKFTEAGGQINVKVAVTDDLAVIEVHDTGKGIPLESHDKIFTTYYQVKDFGQQTMGIGVGLALSKNIIDLHHGTITFTSKPSTANETGSTSFFVKLKMGSNHFAPEELVAPPKNNAGYFDNAPPKELQQVEPLSRGNMQVPDILVVEDNEGIRSFIYENLSPKFNVFQSANGNDGLAMAFDKIPDIIISDIMMPGINGIEFTRQLKSDERTSHIPVILLTALSDSTHQIEGLQTGADLYVSKPFKIQILELSIHNLLSARAAMRKKFSKELTLKPSEVAINSTEEEFLNRMTKIIEDNLEDPDFGVDKLVKQLGIGRNILYKKLDALTGMSVHDIIKSIRLKRSLQLLETQQYAVYEVAEMVGFNDHKYFSKEFKKLFGKSPVEVKTKKSISDGG